MRRINGQLSALVKGEPTLMEPPVISVVMPVHNHESLCGRALASIRRQSCTAIEAIVVDDGSTDRTREHLLAAAAADPRVQMLSVSHRGIAGALRAGVEQARGEFIARMDADDFCSGQRFEHQLEYLRSDDRFGAVDCLVDLEESQATGGGMRSYVEWLNSLAGWDRIRAALFEESPLVHPAVLMRREALDKAGGYLEEPGPEDYSLWLRMVEAGYRLGKTPHRLFTWSDPPERLTRIGDDYRQDAFMALKARFLPRLHSRTNREGVQIWGAGPTGRRFARHLVSQGVRVHRFFDVDPRKIGNTLCGAPVLALDELPAHRAVLTLVALGTRAAKMKVCEWCRVHGFEVVRDYLFVA